MEPPNSDPPKLPDMIMCGDHPSITKTELNVKEERPDENQETDKKEKTSRTERVVPAEANARARSEHALRPHAARRHAGELDGVSRHEGINAPANRALLQAALGSFRWPPYLVAAWAAVLLLTHALHCLAGVLQRTLPPLQKLCAYFQSWTEEAWHGDAEGGRTRSVALAAVTAALYLVYCALWAAHALALWAVEPLGGDDLREDEMRVTSYAGDSATKVNVAANK